jgi:tetratricopeptide (TPR) repeat protein
MKQTWLIMSIALALFVATQAQAGPEEEAKAAFDRGRSFFISGKYEEAIVQLQKAYTIKPHPALLRYIGDSYFKLNKAKEAISHYKRYLQEAPQAVDRVKVEGKVRQLEMIIGSSEEETRPAPTPVPPAGVAKAPGPAEPVIVPPTGEDNEVPVALAPKSLQPTPAAEKREEGTRPLSVLKWVFLGVGVAGLGTGIALNRVAASKATELEDAVKAKNPEMNNPPDKFTFEVEHFDLQQSYKNANTISLVSLIGGGVLTATALVFFLLDKPSEQSGRTAVREHPLALSPIAGGGTLGLAAEVGF